jgi:hypothetical protein
LQRISPRSIAKAVGKSSCGWLGFLISPLGEGISRLVSGKGLVEDISSILPDISFENIQVLHPGESWSRSFGIAQINLITANSILEEGKKEGIPFSFDPDMFLNLPEKEKNSALANLLHSSPEFSIEMAAANMALNKKDIETNAAGYQQGLSENQMNYLLITSYNYGDIVNWVGQSSSFSDLNAKIRGSSTAMNYWNTAGYVYYNMIR